MTPWSIGWVFHVVFGGKNTKFMALRSATSGWAGQLSTTRATFLPSHSNFRSCSLTHSSKSLLSIQLLFCARYLQGRFHTPLKHLGFFDLPITNMGSFSPVALAAASPVRRTLLHFPPTQSSDFRCIDLSGKAL